MLLNLSNDYHRYQGSTRRRNWGRCHQNGEENSYTDQKLKKPFQGHLTGASVITPTCTELCLKDSVCCMLMIHIYKSGSPTEACGSMTACY